MNPVVTVSQISYFDDRLYRLTLSDETKILLPSVTTYLGINPKPRFARWRGDVGNETADQHIAEAMARGSRIHHACYTWTTGGAIIYDPPYEKGLKEINEQSLLVKQQCVGAGVPYLTISDQDVYMALRRWSLIMAQFYPDGNILIHAAESIVWSPTLQCAGKLDYLLELPAGKYSVSGATPLVLDAGIYVLDIKSGYEDADHWMQLAAYLACYEEMAHVPVTGALLAYLDAETRTGAVPGAKVVMREREKLLSDDLTDFQAVQRIWRRNNPNFTPKVFEFPNVTVRTTVAVPLSTGTLAPTIKTSTDQVIATAVEPAERKIGELELLQPVTRPEKETKKPKKGE